MRGCRRRNRRIARRTRGKTSERKNALMMKKGTCGTIGMRTPITPRMKKTAAQKRFHARLRGFFRLRGGRSGVRSVLVIAERYERYARTAQPTGGRRAEPGSLRS